MRWGNRSVIVVLIAAALAAGAGAQARKRAVKRDANRPDERAAPAVPLVERTPADYLSGEANVAVRGNQNPVIKLGLSPNGATIIEFPAADKLFNIIPGNSNLVTVEESPTKDLDRFIIVRPGEGFASPTTMAQARRQPATSVMAQMTSGLVITFLFYPVPQLAEQAHRVVVTYDRNEVVAARRAAGLAVNLDSGADEARPKTTSLRLAPSPNNTGPVESASSSPSEESRSKSQPPAPEESRVGKVDLNDVVAAALTQAKKSPESFKKWGKEAHGLSISVHPLHDLDGRTQVAVFAVRNDRKAAVWIVPGQPEIHIETVAAGGKDDLVTVEPVKKLAEATTAVSGLIHGKSTVYYAVAYQAPILGARQKLRVGVGSTTAADEPALASLGETR